MRILLTLALLFSASFVLQSDTLTAATAAAPGQIIGRVVDVNGDAVADAEVRIEMTHRSGRTFTLNTSTDRRGHFSFDRVPESRGVIRAGKRGVGRDRARVGVRSGNTTRVGLELQ